MGEAIRTAIKAPETKKENQVSQVQKGNFYQSLSSPVEQILFLQRTVGNQAVQRLMKSGTLQAKLRIGAPGDIYEQEADRVADVVMRMLEPQAVSSSTPYIQRACPKCENDEPKRQPIEEEEEKVQAKATSGSLSEVNPDTESHIQSLKGGGKYLSENDRAFFESRFGSDFNQVRVHTDAKAAEVARAVDARAFTVGRDVVFGEGEYAPDTGEGRKLLAHELVHTLQQHPTGKNPASPVIELAVLSPPSSLIQCEGPSARQDPIQDAINSATKRFPNLEVYLNQVTLRITIAGDSGTYNVTGEGISKYPIQIQQAQAGMYLIKWDAQGDIEDIADLSTGNPPVVKPVIPILAGNQEAREKRKLRIGIGWITQTVTAPPKPHPPRPDELQLPLFPAYEITEENFHRALELYPPHPLSIPGLTGGIFEPEYRGESGIRGYYGRPLNFVYYTHDGVRVLVSRQLVGRDFYYLVPVADIQNYLRYYPLEYAGLAAAPMATFAQIVTDIGISFIPIIGPIYGLIQASVMVYRSYQNWDKMSGWEKALVGVTALLSVVPAVRGASRIVSGTRAFNEGVGSLVTAGLTRADARRLMLAAGVFQSERATLRIVDTLGDALSRGERLTASQIQQLEGIFRLMLQRLPAAERAAISASFATQRLETASKFFEGVELTERHLVGLRRLSPQVLVLLQKAGKDSPLIIQRIALMAERSEEIAMAIDRLHMTLGARGQRFLTQIVTEAGDDVLIQLGRGTVNISDKLAAYVRNARTASQAYQHLMQGTTRAGRNIPGLASLLSGTREIALPKALADIQEEFGRTFLTAGQLSGLARLDATVRQALRGASDSQIRVITAIAGGSGHAADAINQLGLRLGPHVKSANLPDILHRIGGGVLDAVGRTGITLSDDLVREVGRQSSAYRASKTLLEGFTKKKVHVSGLLDELAGRITKVTDIERTLHTIEFPAQQANLFARWAMRNPDLVEGINAIIRLRPADAQGKIAGIYQAFGGNHAVALDVFKSLGQIEKMSGKIDGLNRMIAELAAGAEKTMGASLTLTYAIRRYGGQVGAFEKTVSGLGVARRDYDLVANGIFHEFKYWLGFGGQPAVAAADEFARDIVLHTAQNFKNLKWVISKDAASELLAIQSMMRGVLSRPWVQKALKDQGISVREALKRLEDAMSSGRLIEFF